MAEGAEQAPAVYSVTRSVLSRSIDS